MADTALPHDAPTKAVDILLSEQAARRPDATFAIFPGETLTYGEVNDRARAMAKGLIRLGVKPGDHIATLMPNCADWVIAYFAGLIAGAVVVALNARYKRHELGYALKHSDCRVLLTTDLIADHVDFTSLLRDTLEGLDAQTDRTSLNLTSAPALKALVLMGKVPTSPFLSSEDLIALGADIPDAEVDAARAQRDVGDTSTIIYTSGTTSTPKGCELTHQGLQASWSTFANTVSLRPDETVWTPMPFYHTGGVGPMTIILATGAAFMTQPHYQAEQAVELIEQHRIAHLYSGFPQLSITVIEHPRFNKDRFDFVRSMLNVGPEALQRRIQAALPDHAVLLNLFGMTEGAGIVTFARWDAPLDVRAVSSGYPPENTQVRICDPETNIESPRGAPGEIQFRGGGAFRSYYKDPEATAATILPGGWVKTGDRGRMDPDGALTFLGRIKDMLKVGGENVAAAEIEAFIQGLPGVKMVQIIGIPHKRLTEVPVAFVERDPGSTITETEVIAACTGRLANWKVPRHVIFVTDWPMSTTKVQKFRLKEYLPADLVESA
ncbi:MAG: class I adenylate-forming enzyme family protein [Brevundimonas sp.]|uniref:class I adenylate-forming enzyme family protein n=1 Tax=Brevundimonas sp. TaxID=1871086 RepID=UPI0024882D1A|nr:class I adenylate-forming enzyme family protein [Brevundimonas sp.]MDI1327579.1 class I adenylate-forming enzyme family protein [Brevundimonas sp.]